MVCLTAGLIGWQATSAHAELPLKINATHAQSIGKKIWHNEGLGKVENLTVWNEGEAFPSFGIGHFIWYPSGTEGPFKESFPGLIKHLATTHTLPAWLKNQQHAPWRSREDFYQNIDSPRMKSLRLLLQRSTGAQVSFIIARMEAALPTMLASLDQTKDKQHVKKQFYRVAQQSQGIYALIDYVNFKGEGTSPKERYKGQGWGLLQVLENMPDDHINTMQAFRNAADLVLSRRVANAPRDETRWLAGWRNRLNTYK